MCNLELNTEKSQILSHDDSFSYLVFDVYLQLGKITFKYQSFSIWIHLKFVIALTPMIISYNFSAIFSDFGLLSGSLKHRDILHLVRIMRIHFSQ